MELDQSGTATVFEGRNSFQLESTEPFLWLDDDHLLAQRNGDRLPSIIEVGAKTAVPIERTYPLDPGAARR